MDHGHFVARRRWLGHALGLGSGAALLALAPRAARALPLPAERHIALSHLHTREQIATVYAVEHRLVPAALGSLNLFLRDHYSGEVGDMDPRLYDLLTGVRRVLGVDRPYEVVSGYRSAHTNERLRNTRGGGVAQRSLHMDGRAVDVRLPGVPLPDLRDAARSLKAGGVGFYPAEGFVHIDTGRVRHW
jgi:uncharacterized protein YcbK (DUF882 family)